MDPSLSPVTKSMFNDLLETQTRLRDEAEQKWLSSRKFIQEIVGQVASEWLDEKQKSGLELERIPLEVLANVIRERISQLLIQKQPLAHTPDLDLRQKYQRLAEDFRQAEINALEIKKEKDTLASLVKQLTNEVEIAKKSADKAAMLSAHYQNWEILPDFFMEWTQENFFDRQSYLIRLIGETGLSRAPELKIKLKAKFDLSKTSGSAEDALKSLQEMGFVYGFGTEGGLRGRPPDIVELTKLGQAVYTFLTGKKPIVSEFAIKKEHKTDAHTLLVLKAMDWLQKAGYQILGQAPRLETEDQRQFNPDIVAQKGAEPFYIEVERNSRKGNQDRETKWKNFHAYTGGRMFFICENTKAQMKLIREMNVAIRHSGLHQAKTSFCDLSRLNDEYLKQHGDIWTSTRGEDNAQI